LAVD
jgi:hypothetical protein